MMPVIILPIELPLALAAVSLAASLVTIVLFAAFRGQSDRGRITIESEVLLANAALACAGVSCGLWIAIGSMFWFQQ
jgi:hypothetical protein